MGVAVLPRGGSYGGDASNIGMGPEHPQPLMIYTRTLE